jgi:alpha,alpha-trehalase
MLDGKDYTTANDPTVTPALNDTQKASLYAELASGAETGWDYTMRWFSVGKESEGLRSLNVRNTVGVDLNSILCGSSIPNPILMLIDQ